MDDKASITHEQNKNAKKNMTKTTTRSPSRAKKSPDNFDWKENKKL
jgi:hypothetical protein